MIIVEGPDGAGKTTLVMTLLKEYPELRIGVRGTSDRNFLWKVTVADTMKALGTFAHSRGHVTIWDRLFYSELVYAPLGIPPRKVEFNEMQISHVQNIIHAADFPVIVCMPARDVVVDNILSEREQMSGVKEKAALIWDRYDELLHTDTFPGRTTIYDYSGFSGRTALEEIKRDVADYIDSKRERSW